MTAVPLAPGFADDHVPAPGARAGELRAYRRMLRIAGRGVAQPAPGRGTPAVLVPGFLSGEVSLTLLSRELRRHGHRTFASSVGANVGCTEQMVDRLVRRLEAVVAAEGRPVALVGHSRGGMVASVTARRRPDLLAGLIVLSAPVTGSLSVAPHVRRQLELLFRLNRRGLGRVLGADCVAGECAARVAAELGRALPGRPALHLRLLPRRRDHRLAHLPRPRCRAGRGRGRPRRYGHRSRCVAHRRTAADAAAVITRAERGRLPGCPNCPRSSPPAP